MLLIVKAETSIKDLVIDYIDVICASGKTISLNWEQSDVSKTSTGFYAEYLGVCFDDKLAKGQLSELREMHVDVIGLHSEQEGKLDIDVKEMCFYEDEKELIFSNPFQTEDNDACMEWLQARSDSVRRQELAQRLIARIAAPCKLLGQRKGEGTGLLSTCKFFIKIIKGGIFAKWIIGG